MITESFDNKTSARFNPSPSKKQTKCDVCLVTFSHLIKKYVLENFICKQVGESINATGIEPVYIFKNKSKTIGFYQTWLGAPASVALFEDITAHLECEKFIFFGAAAPLKKEKSNGKIMVPTHAYRDEGTSYHYAKAKDCIKLKNANIVSKILKEENIPFVSGRIWTTDAFYRETEKNIEARKTDGCIAIDMECSAMEAVCEFRKKRTLLLCCMRRFDKCSSLAKQICR